MKDDSSQPDPSDSRSMEHLWRALHKGRWLILAVATVVSAAAAFYTLGQTKIYRAVAVIQIDPTPVSPLGGDVQAVVTMGADNFFTNQEYYATQYRILKSRRTATDAVKDLGLHRDASFAKNQAAASGTEVPESTAADALLARLSVDPIKESRLVTVSFDDADPERARRVLSAVINSYLERNVDDVALSNTTASKWLQEQLSKLKKDLEKSELALHEFKKEKRILSVSLDDQNNMLGDEIKQLNAALTQVRTQREHVQSRAQELSKVDRSDPVALPAAELLENGLLTTLRGNYISAKSDLASIQKSGKGDNHPDVRASAARVATTRDALLKEIKNVQDAVGGNLRALTREAGGLKRLNDGAKQRALDINILEIEYRRLERTKVNNEKLFGVVLERTKETQLASMMRFNNIRVVEEARATAGPVKPRVPLNIGLGVMAGVLLGLITAFARDQLDRSVKTSDDVERELGLSFLGSLPLSGGPGSAKRDISDRPEMQAHDQPTSALAEAARGIRTNLLFMSPDKPYARLLVTSPSPGEGKTTVASTIAIAMAQAGQRVLLVDCDLRRPRLHKVFGRKNDLGLTSVTIDPSKLDHEALKTEVENLYVLPSGPRVPNPAEFLQSDALTALLNRLGDQFDRVVIDSPPASIVSDATILGTRVDGVVYVVRSSKTQRDVAKKGLRSLRDVGAPVVGGVLNALDLVRLGYGKYSNYYQYGYYGRHEDETDGPS